MSFNPNLISFRLSGGQDNTNPNLSLGGEPSKMPLIGTINNIFDDVSEASVETGYVDYRCFYIFNETGVDLSDIQLWISSEVDTGSTIELGFLQANEIQQITVIYQSASPPTSGSLNLVYNYESEAAEWDEDKDVFAENIQAALAALNLETTVTVVKKTSGSLSFLIFNLLFTGESSGIFYDLLDLESSLNGSVEKIYVNKVNDGGPINATAVEIDKPTTDPSGITFTYPTSTDPYVIGDVLNHQGFAVWIRRTTERNAESILEDGFSIIVDATYAMS